MNFSTNKKIEFAEISIIAHGFSNNELNQFKSIHWNGNEEGYLKILLNAIECLKNNISVSDILLYPKQLDII